MLDNLPLATIGYVVLMVVGAIECIKGTITFEQYGAAAGVGTLGIGVVRNQAGKGVRK